MLPSMNGRIKTRNDVIHGLSVTMEDVYAFYVYPKGKSFASLIALFVGNYRIKLPSYWFIIWVR